MADVGRRCRQLLIAAASAAYRPWMLPNGEEAPQESNAKRKIELVLAAVENGSLDKRVSALMGKAWDVAVGLLHQDEPARVATFAAAQATILAVRTLAMIDGELGEQGR